VAHAKKPQKESQAMLEPIQPRRIEMWEFFNENMDAAGPQFLGRLADLSPGHRGAADFFIEALGGRRKALDIGCGEGLPALYLAERVGAVVGLDAAPNMIAAARANARRLALANASFEVGGLEALSFSDREFDGASICGALESMDWPDALRTIVEVRRVLEPGGRLAVLEQDWRDILNTRPEREACIRLENGRLWFQITERRSHPHAERQTCYFVVPDSASGQRLREELGDDARRATAMAIGELHPRDIVDAWYHETAQFDSETLADLLESNGFRDLTTTCERVWTEEVLLVTAVRA
jgi:SAM-dependent methyltransferase